MVASVALFAVTVLNAAGAWAGTPGGMVPRVGALILPVMMWSLLCVGVVLLQRDRVDALLLIGLASAGLAGVFGFADLGWLSSAVLPSALLEPVARATVALAMGVGSGLAVHAALDAGPELVDRAAARRAAAERTVVDGSRSVDPVHLLRRQRWLLMVPIVAIAIGIGIISSSDDTTAMVDPALSDDVCAGTGAADPTVTDELHVRLHQLVLATAQVDPDAAQRLSDSVDAIDAEGPTQEAAAEVRADLDAALVATGQDRLGCDRS